MRLDASIASIRFSRTKELIHLNCTLTALTPWQALVHNAKLKAGQKVLVHTASGGVGHFAVTAR